jgi:hypothetical protein
MKLIYFITALSLLACNSKANEITEITSPNENVMVKFNINKEGRPFYLVKFNNKTVVDSSYLGFEFKDAPSFEKNFIIKKTSTSAFNDIWQMPWGEQLNVVNNYNELRVELQEKTRPERFLNIVFKVYNDGIGFRYEFPEQARFKGDVLITLLKITKLFGFQATGISMSICIAPQNYRKLMRLNILTMLI